MPVSGLKETRLNRYQISMTVSNQKSEPDFWSLFQAAVNSGTCVIGLRQQKSQRGKKITIAATTAVTDRVKQRRSSTCVSTLQSHWLDDDSPGVVSVNWSSRDDCFRPTAPSLGAIESQLRNTRDSTSMNTCKHKKRAEMKSR